jgi:NADP-dependent 3-hydroxy acid dehydrogenase YdfG
MKDKFAGKIAVVTGGSTGMGLSTAKRFVQGPEPSDTLNALKTLKQ